MGKNPYGFVGREVKAEGKVTFRWQIDGKPGS